MAEPDNGAYLDSLGWAYFSKRRSERGPEVPGAGGQPHAAQLRGAGSPRRRARRAAACRTRSTPGRARSKATAATSIAPRFRTKINDARSKLRSSGCNRAPLRAPTPARASASGSELRWASCRRLRPARVTLPTDSGSPLPDFAAVHAQRQPRLPRRAHADGGTRALRPRRRPAPARPRHRRVRAAGVDAPRGRGAVRAAGVHPGRARRRRRRCCCRATSGWCAAPARRTILGALTGVALAPADLLAVLTGCVVPAPAPRAAGSTPTGWASIDLDGQRHAVSRARQRRRGSCAPRARRAGTIAVRARGRATFPAACVLRSTSRPRRRAVGGDLAARSPTCRSTPSAFTVTVPPTTKPLTLEELREAGPLRGR